MKDKILSFVFAVCLTVSPIIFVGCAVDPSNTSNNNTKTNQVSNDYQTVARSLENEYTEIVGNSLPRVMEHDDLVTLGTKLVAFKWKIINNDYDELGDRCQDVLNRTENALIDVSNALDRRYEEMSLIMSTEELMQTKAQDRSMLGVEIVPVEE